MHSLAASKPFQVSICSSLGLTKQLVYAALVYESGEIVQATKINMPKPTVNEGRFIRLTVPSPFSFDESRHVNRHTNLQKDHKLPSLLAFGPRSFI